MANHDIGITRRGFIAGSGLVIGIALAPKLLKAAQTGVPAGGGPELVPLNVFVKVGTDDTITILSKHLEMGQGPFTGLATLVAEEMDADWSQMRAVHSPADDELYANLAYGIQGTGSSNAISNSFDQIRLAGATARSMLIAAAAEEWHVPATEIMIRNGRIRHPASGQESGFGAFAERAARQQGVAEPTLKAPEDYVLIGTDLPKLDTRGKIDGTAVFTLDVTPDEVVVAVVAHPEHFGATIASFDDSETRAIQGVIDVQQVPSGIAVYANDTFAAMKGRDALRIEWDLSNAETRSSAEIATDYVRRFGQQGIVATDNGNVDEAFGAPGVQMVEAEIVFPFLAHAPMETLDAVFVPTPDGSVDIYTGAQFPTMDRDAAADILGLQQSQVRLHTQMTGGAFGRKAQFGSPYMREAAAAFAASERTRPLKHMWTREDDIRGGYYRPMYAHKMRGAISPEGEITAWEQIIVGQSIMGKVDLDETSVEGASNLPYAIPNLKLTSHNVELVVPPLWWRSVGHTHTGFAVETFVDELLARVGRDPVVGRLALLSDKPRHAAVLKKAAEMADWGAALAEGRARGVAVVESFHTYVAQVVELSVDPEGTPLVHKVWCAVDCGLAINPNIIKAQMEGGIGFGLGAILFDAVTLGPGGKIVQSNFHDYRSLRINEMPDVSVEIIKSSERPSGVGEPGVPPIGPAVANALRSLTGTPVRQLPIVNIASA